MKKVIVIQIFHVVVYGFVGDFQKVDTMRWSNIAFRSKNQFVVG